MFGFFKKNSNSIIQVDGGEIFMTGDENIVVNGISYKGKNISVQNNTVVIDGVVVQKEVSGIVAVKVTGDLANFSCNAPATIHGDVYGFVEVNGPLDCGNIQGDVDANGPITMRHEQ